MAQVIYLLYGTFHYPIRVTTLNAHMVQAYNLKLVSIVRIDNALNVCEPGTKRGDWTGTKWVRVDNTNHTDVKLI